MNNTTTSISAVGTTPPPDTTTIPQIRFKKTTLLVGLIVTVAFDASLYFFLGVTDIKELASVFTAGIVCTTLFYHAQNLQTNYELNQEKLAQDRALSLDKTAQDKKISSITTFGISENLWESILTAIIFFEQNPHTDDIHNLISNPENEKVRLAIGRTL